MVAPVLWEDLLNSAAVPVNSCIHGSITRHAYQTFANFQKDLGHGQQEWEGGGDPGRENNRSGTNTVNTSTYTVQPTLYFKFKGHIG